jgi:hypothetical protein
MRALTELFHGTELVFDLRNLNSAVKRNDFPRKELTLAHIRFMARAVVRQYLISERVSHLFALATLRREKVLCGLRQTPRRREAQRARSLPHHLWL